MEKNISYFFGNDEERRKEENKREQKIFCYFKMAKTTFQKAVGLGQDYTI